MTAKQMDHIGCAPLHTHLIRAVFSMKNNKVPGDDSMPAEVNKQTGVVCSAGATAGRF